MLNLAWRQSYLDYLSTLDNKTSERSSVTLVLDLVQAGRSNLRPQ